MPRYVVCYDIASSKRRGKVAYCLDSYGDRAQESVFELKVSPRRFDWCLERIRALIDPAVDLVAVYALCANREGRRLYLGADELAGTIGDEQVFIA